MDRRNTNRKHILILMPYLVKRIVEVFIIEFSLSAIIAAPFYYNFLPQTDRMGTVFMMLCLILYIWHTVKCLKLYLQEVRLARIYYRVNLTVMGAFALLCIAMAYINFEPLYTWLFFPFKLLYIWLDVPKVLSALIINLILLLCVVAIHALRKVLDI